MARRQFEFQLYIAGSTPNSMRAVSNLRKICDSFLAKNYEIEIIDLYKRPEAAKEQELVAVPTLIRRAPGPVKYIVGDLSNTGKVLAALGIETANEA